MKDRAYYEELFSSYPDVVTISQLCEMLGGMADKTARRLLSQKTINNFYIRNTYFIPKPFVLDFVLSNEYSELRKRLKHKI